MSSHTREKAVARERVAAMRAAEARAARGRRLLVAGGAIGVVVVLMVALVVAKAAGVGSGSDATTSAGQTGPTADGAGAAVVKAVTGVPVAVLDEVGAGDVQAVPRTLDAPALTSDGKPQVLYVGAEYCPFCAAQRWPVVVALSRFGAWSGLGQTTSASEDLFPDTASLSFHGASYTSDYLSFTGVETSGRKPVGGQYPPLDKLSPVDQATFERYNQPEYTGMSAGAIPFLDIGGAYVFTGSSFDPGVLVGESHSQIAAALADPNSPVTRAVDGTANVLTAALCEVTDQQPATVCAAPGVSAAGKVLADAQPS